MMSKVNQFHKTLFVSIEAMGMSIISISVRDIRDVVNILNNYKFKITANVLSFHSFERNHKHSLSFSLSYSLSLSLSLTRSP